MASIIDPALATEFSQMVHHNAQQINSRTRPNVITKPMNADLFAYDGLGTVEAREITGRNVAVEFDDIEHLRRRINRRVFTVVLPVDLSDVNGTFQSQMQEYSTTVLRALNRATDRLVIEAALATVYTGRNFETAIAFAADGVATVDATAGLTYEKLLEAGQNFTDNEVGNDMSENFHLYLSGAEETALMSETELTSGDFTRQSVIDKGRMTFAGQFALTKFGASVSNPILAESGGLRNCLAMSDRAICLGISSDITIKTQERNDLHRTTQVVAEWEMGAVRTEGKLIQVVQTTV